VKITPLGSEVELVIDSASTRTMRYLGVDFWVAIGYLDKVGSVSGLVEGRGELYSG